MNGVYHLYDDGKKIASATNTLTNLGKRSILDAFVMSPVARSIAVGIGGTAPTVNDTSLQFEVQRGPITVVSPDYINTAIIYKASLSEVFSGKIYELGLWSTDSPTDQRNSSMLFNFDDRSTWTGGLFNATNARAGANALVVTAAAGATTIATNTLPSPTDLSNYSANDDFIFALYNDNANPVTVVFRAGQDTLNYFKATLPSLSVGYNIVSFKRSAFTAVGNPDWAMVSYFAMVVTASASGAVSVTFDAARVEDRDRQDTSYVLVSRAVLAVPAVKRLGYPMEVEYVLDVTI